MSTHARLVVLLIGCAITGCRESGLPAGGDAGTGTVGPRPDACPSTLPSEGSSCSQSDLQCEYGDDFNPACNKIVVCSSSGRWAQPFFGGGSQATCPTPAPQSNPADCAPSRGAVPTGQACTTSSSCEYPGSICSCSAFCRSFPVGEPDCNADAGVTTNCCDRSAVRWNCFDGPQPCTQPRPSVGTPCTTEGPSCAVEQPGECGQHILACQQGHWTLSGGECPVSSARYKQDIAYLDTDRAEALRAELMRVRLATYRYRSGDEATHLGFIIEDMPASSPAVLPSRDRVDLYGYLSMAVATIQRQEKELQELKQEVVRMKRRR